MTWVLLLIILLTNGETLLVSSIQPSPEACIKAHANVEKVAKVSNDIADVKGICVRAELDPNAKGRTL